jgi:hypothetical protein
MQQEPMRSPANQEPNQEPNQEILGENDADFLLTSAQEAAMLATYGTDNDDDSRFDLQDSDADEQDSKQNKSPDQNQDLKATQKTDKTAFHNNYVGYMDLFADQQTVMKYLDAHQGWFRRCAHPFKADPIGETGYAMGVGKVGAMGFQVDARVGLDLLPPDANSVYRIVTIPIPNQLPQGYEVDFHAEMRLEEKTLDLQVGSQVGQNAVMTSIEWDLNITVSLQFPPFIQRLSQDMLQKTGDGVLGFVVKRVSKSLTAKVQDDFHKTHEIKVPKQIKLRR